jgi:hypothetical protein
VGKHTAAEGASADPIVADALASRSAGAGHSADGARATQERGIGWPATPAPRGGGLGWPGDLRGRGSAA